MAIHPRRRLAPGEPTDEAAGEEEATRRAPGGGGECLDLGLTRRCAGGQPVPAPGGAVTRCAGVEFFMPLMPPSPVRPAPALPVRALAGGRTPPAAPAAGAACIRGRLFMRRPARGERRTRTPTPTSEPWRASQPEPAAPCNARNRQWRRSRALPEAAAARRRWGASRAARRTT